MLTSPTTPAVLPAPYAAGGDPAEPREFVSVDDERRSRPASVERTIGGH